MQAIEVQLQLSNSQLHHALEDRTWQCSQLEVHVSSMREKIAELGERAEAAKALEDVQARELHALKGALRAKELEMSQLQRSLDRQAQHSAEMESEVAAYRKSLEEERARHTRELTEISDEHSQEEDRARSLFSRLSFTEVIFP
jgi:predicted  nucleic acid-binding Zn-ribbon protein